MNATEDAARRLLAPHLWDREEVLWCDLPQGTNAVAAASARQGFFATVIAVSGLAVVFLYAGTSFIRKDDPSSGVFVLGFGAALISAVLMGRTMMAWLRGQRAARGMAYGVTNRRVLIVHGDELEWVGPKQMEDVVIRGGNVVVTRQRSELESLWNPEAPGFVDENTPGQGLIEKANTAQREMTLAALRYPQHVLALVQTLQHRTAS